MNHEIYGGPTDQPWGFRFVTNPHQWMQGAEPIYSEPSHPTQIYEGVFYLLVFAVTVFMYWKTDAKDRQGLILGVGILLIFLFRFFVEFLKNVQVQSEIAMREDTGLILGQWLSIPFIIWGIWLIWNALRHPARVAVTPKQSQMAQPRPKKKK
jgi:phosphatidylglycerol:prolipoprotein diacylglycerol transferase